MLKFLNNVWLLKNSSHIYEQQYIIMEKVKKRYTVEQEQMARFAKTLSHPVRIVILQLLASQTCCYHGDMSEILPVEKSTLSSI